MMKSLAKKLRNTRLLGPLTTDKIEFLLEQQKILQAHSGDIIFKETDNVVDHLVLLEGELEAQHTWSTPNGHDKSYTRIIKPDEYESKLGLICAANRTRIRALSKVSYVLINANKVDKLLGWSQQFSDDMKNDPDLQRRINLFKHVSVFHELPLDNLTAAFACMYDKVVNAGETIITQGETGDCYYVIDSGEAEVIKTDPFTDKVDTSVKLGPGDAFGEEALLQNAYRNATIVMTTPGTLLVLEKSDFDSLLKPHIVAEVNAEEAQSLIENNTAKWIDCRYEIEYEESRIPNAPLIPLDQLRFNLDKLNPDEKYIVYCRSGRRSKAGAFLLRERNINAVSLTGGIKHWPYEIDTTLLE